MNSQSPKTPVVPKQYLVPFILTTLCFALWGFANDITNPLVKVFKSVFLISNAESSLVQAAFYGGYFTMALPAALFIRRFSYKTAIMIGFALYAAGAFLSLPASIAANFHIFLLGFYVLTFGLAFLETACNPYILAMGPPETATQRLNLAQAFNPAGILIGLFVFGQFVAPNLEISKLNGGIKEQDSTYTQYLYTSETPLPEGAKIIGDDKLKLSTGEEVTFHKDGLPDYKNTFGKLDGSVIDSLTAMRATAPEEFKNLQQADLASVRTPYLTVGCVVLAILLIFAFSKMPAFKSETKPEPFIPICKKIWALPHFREGVLAQAFYVGAQITCWTFITHYAMEIAQLSLATAAKWSMASAVIFLISRFICTYLMRSISAGLLMGILAIVAIFLLMGVIFLDKTVGLTCLVSVSGCMSLMFPTIYGIALRGMPIEEAKIGSAFLIMAIVGGAILPLLQGKFMDHLGVRDSFWLPIICFIFVAIYSFRSYLKFEKQPLPSEA